VTDVSKNERIMKQSKAEETKMKEPPKLKLTDNKCITPKETENMSQKNPSRSSSGVKDFL
jgi:hypothetical protein